MTDHSLTLPEPIAAYFAADKLDAEAVARCFTADGEVRDEGHAHKGIAAIKQWKAGSSAKYTYTCQPIKIETANERFVVTVHLEGNFPVGSADLRYFFRLERAKISSLEIAP